MSVLQFPRLYFKGLVSWDPGLANNTQQASFFNPDTMELTPPAGQDFSTLRKWMIDQRVVGWNYCGTHDCEFVPGQTVITGGQLSFGQQPIAADPIVGKRVNLRGKLVDLDPRAVWNSQMYFDRFAIGGTDVGFSAPRFRRMHSRWINFQRNAGGLPIAGGASATWQTCFRKADIQFNGAAGSALLLAFQQELQRPEIAGIMMRFNAYRTLYFQNGILNSIPETPRSEDDLAELYLSGANFSNPAYSALVGVIGLWRQEELVSAPAGRYLVPTQRLATSDGAFQNLICGPAVAEIDELEKVVSIDLNNAIPELDVALTKADFGSLTLATADDDGNVTAIAPIASAEYGRTAYEAKAGIVDAFYGNHADPLIDDKIKAGRLVLLASQNGTSVAALTEQPLTVQTDERDNYLDEGEQSAIRLAVRFKGAIPPAAVRVLVTLYDPSLDRLPGASVTLSADSAGETLLPLAATAPSCLNFGLQPFFAGTPQPAPPPTLNVMAAFYASLRILPFDNQLESQTTDAELTWQFVYERILRVYDLLNPVMSRIGIDLDLSDEQAVRGQAQAIKNLISVARIESRSYMPVTRDLSAGKRGLLARWCDLALQRFAPDDMTIGDALEQSNAIAPAASMNRIR